MAELQRLHVRYRGVVQGVGFRATCRSLARGFAVSGFVRNLPDGSVELEAQGDRAEVDAFLAAIRRHWGDAIERADTATASVVAGEAEFVVRR